MDPKLKFSCTEGWSNMRVGIVGRHCFKCDKVVMDFTDKSKTQLIQYLVEHRDRSVCGRVRMDQLDIYNEFVEICIWRSLRTNRTSNLAFYLMAIGGMTIAGCGNPTDRDGTYTDGGDTTTTFDSLTSSSGSTNDTVSSLQQPRTTPDRAETPNDIQLVVGEMILDDERAYDSDHAQQLPEMMPEFPGGQDSLFAFMRKHINYPEWEADNNIDGKVYVEFEVEKDGTITDPRIRRSVQGTRNFDGEVLRVMKLMPRWSPGRNGNDVVKTKLVLPVVFSL